MRITYFTKKIIDAWQFNLCNPFNVLLLMGDTGYCDEIKSEITYCLDNPRELSFTMETENTL